MAIFKCKMCGGALEINNETVAVCQYCGTNQTLPRLDDDRKANLYDRANHFRRNNEFDKAMGIYEQILNDDNTDAETYWSLVLCRYGIEYVEDPSSHKRIPTINRSQFTSVFDDEDYKSAIKYADDQQKELYENEATVINEIHRRILTISSQEEPFDVFICYKESDIDGHRTPDSVLATELYHELVREGFKVFFARITLEDKLGQEYEPYIFAALNSAKVMVVLGTKPEYFNAVWVKNEWSRYLALIKNGARKMLIPAYKDMDPYDLPEEFSHLQAQDMSKLGFMQDLIRGIKKIVGNNTDKPIVHETIISNETTGNVTALLKRGYIALEDGEWKKADDFFEQCLNQNAELAEAYLGKLMAELKVKTQDDLKYYDVPFDDNSNYKTILRFADSQLKDFIIDTNQFINDRNENARQEKIYNDATEYMTSAETAFQYTYAAEELEKIKGYKDASTLAAECREKAKLAEISAKRMTRRIIKIAFIASAILSVFIVLIIIYSTVIVPNAQYNKAVKLMGAGEYIEAYDIFDSLEGYKDSVEKAESIYDDCEIAKIKSAKVGDYVEFGTYEQDNDKDNGREEIEWIVLESNDNKVFLVSKYALDCQPYNSSGADATWETCSLRKWLNNYFINLAFSAEERGKISTVTVSADKNDDYNTNPGNATQDKMFLLSKTEVEEYFTNIGCIATDYALAEGIWVSYENNECDWWLRTPGKTRELAATVSWWNGRFNSNGILVGISDRGVRPAIWVDISTVE